MIKVCSACGQLEEHKSWKSYTCNKCLDAGLKYCPSCEEVHSIDNFHKNGHTIRSFCKKCEIKRSKESKKASGYADRPEVKAKRLEDSRLCKRAKYAFDEDYRLKEISRSHNRRCTVKQRGVFTSAEWHKALVDFGESCAYCGSKQGLSQDHVVPISKGGMNNATNIVPACSSCNSSKSDHDMLTWYIVQSFYSDARLQRIVFYLKEVMPSVPYRSV